MDKELEEKLIKSVELVLEPIDGKFVSFGNPLFMYSMIRENGDKRSIISEENKITFYHMNLATKYGDLMMSFSSDNLKKDLNYSIVISLGSSSSLVSSLSNEELSKINSNVLDLHKQK